MEFEALGDTLAEHVARAEHEIFLVAPFVTKGALDFLLRTISVEIAPVLVTRWRVEEIAAGVSDVESYELIHERGGSLWLQQSLHAKYFRADDSIMVGSANITATALGLSSRANLEVLQSTSRDLTTDEFELRLLRSAIEVDESFAHRMLELQLDLRAQDPTLARDPTGVDDRWLSELPRDPEDLWRQAAGHDEFLSEISRAQASRTLLALQIPDLRGATADSTQRTVAGALLTEPAIQALYSLVEEPRRFGEVATFVQRRLELDRNEAQRVAQNVIRLVTLYLPDQFSYARPRHSEILFRTPRSQGDSDTPEV